MGSLVREWNGFQQFPVVTQNRLIEIFGKWKDEGLNTLTILVLGKNGVGKSSTINSLIGERVANISSFQSDEPKPVMVSRTRAGFTLHIIDTPGLVESGYVNFQALELIKGFLVEKTIDCMLYVERLDAYRVDNLDKQIISAITGCFGKGIWVKSLVVLTHAQFSPPADISYDTFFSRRSEAILDVICAGSKLKKKELKDAVPNPVCLVENSGRCNKNENGERILPDGSSWIPLLVKGIIDVATNGRRAIFVDKKMVDGSASNDWGKTYIPLIVGIEWLVMQLIKRIISNDVAKGGMRL